MRKLLMFIVFTILAHSYSAAHEANTTPGKVKKVLRVLIKLIEMLG